MWLMTPIGFFSIVQKHSDKSSDTLTIRARVRSDLDALRTNYLPDLSAVSESSHTDYRFRATAPRASVGRAMASFIDNLHYSNFKSEVSKVQGPKRAHLYHHVWDVLYPLQQDPAYAPKPGRPAAAKLNGVHPKKDENGNPVVLKKPHQALPLEHWQNSNLLACVVPGGQMPPDILGREIFSWPDYPRNFDGWLKLAQANQIDEPPFKVPAGYKAAAGVVIREKDGRVWLVAPSNQFGGYLQTFPKGTIEKGMTAQATALVEAYEESGLQVRLISHLVDAKRSQSYTRYYLAERIGGNPADMGWETQAVLLCPPGELGGLLNSAFDQPVVEALHAIAH